MCLLGQPSGQYRGCIRLASFQNFVLHMSVARKTTICGGGVGVLHPFISAIISDKVSFSVSI